MTTNKFARGRGISKLSQSLKNLINTKGIQNSLKSLDSEYAAQKLFDKLSKSKISEQKSGWRPTQKWMNKNLESKKQLIRDVRDIRSQASKARMNWMEQNADKATKIYKSGAVEFGGEANRNALQQITNDITNPFIQKLAADIRKDRLKKVGIVTATGLLPSILVANKIPLVHNMVGEVVPYLPTNVQKYAYQAGPYLRQWLDYNTGGAKYGLEMSPEMAEQYLQDAITEKVGNRNFEVGDTIHGVPLGSESKTYQKYIKAGGDSAQVANAMYSQLGTIQHVVKKPNNKLQVIDAYDWEPMDTKENYEDRVAKQKKSIEKGDGSYTNSDLWRTRMERPAQWAAEHNLLMPDMQKMNIRSNKKHNPNLKPKAWVGYDFEINN